MLQCVDSCTVTQSFFVCIVTPVYFSTRRVLYVTVYSHPCVRSYEQSRIRFCVESLICTSLGVQSLVYIIVYTVPRVFVSVCTVTYVYVSVFTVTRVYSIVWLFTCTLLCTVDHVYFIVCTITHMHGSVYRHCV